MTKKLIPVLFLLLFTAIGFAQSQTFAITGNNTYTAPAGVTSITVEAWGGGGKGGTRVTNGAGGGGGGGAYSSKVFTVVPGNNYALYVGAGSNTTAAGADSWFIASATMRAKGGNSVPDNTSTGATGGTAAGSLGDVTYSGGNGATGLTSNYSGGGGSAAEDNSNGGNGSGQTGAVGTLGGSGGDGRGASNGNGNNGSAPGGGGGGAYRSSSSTRLGGFGGDGVVIVTVNNPEIDVLGNSTSIVDGDATPTTTDWTDFGTINTGQNFTRTFTIQNTGTAALTIGAITFSGTNAADFTITTAPASSVAAGGSTTFVVKFTPSAIGTRTASISIVNNDSNENPYNFSIQGTAINPEINITGNGSGIVDGDVTPAAADWTDFGTTDALAGTITRTFTIQNTGTTALTIGAITFTGAASGDFTVTTAPAGSIVAASSTTFVVTFNPSAAGLRSATINIANNDATENPYAFAIQGMGTDPEMNIQGNATTIADGNVIPSAADWTDFGSADITIQTITRTFTIENLNTGNIALSIGAITISGTNAADFVVTTPPASSVAVNGSTTFIVTFNPSAAGTRTATISIANNDSNESPYNFSIQGIGTDPEINITGNATTIADGDVLPSVTDWTDFGSTYIASGTVARTFTIQNTGSGILNVGTITIGGTNPGDFTLTTPPAASVAAGGNTTFVVTFDPLALGSRVATLTIANNDTNENPYNFSIQGTGTDPEINLQGNATDIVDGDNTPSASDWTIFGSTDIATGSITRTFTIQNKATGTSALNVGAITITGANSSDFTVTTAPAASVAIAGSTTFIVTFNPSATGIRTATINIANNDSNENPYDFAIQGTGTDPEMNIVGNVTSIPDGSGAPNVTDLTYFGTTDIGAGTITRTFIIENKSTATTNLSIGSILIWGTNASDFSYTAPLSNNLAPNTSTTFTVTFNPSALGVRTALISISSNDSDESPYDFTLQGTGGDPEIDIQGNAVSIIDGDATPSTADATDFGNVEISVTTATKTYTIYNQGTATMALSIGAITFTGTNAADFSAGSLGATSIPIGGSTTFTITFNPSTTGIKTATVHIANNDGNEAPYDFALQGTGTNPEIDVIGNLISIADGDITPSVSDNTDFGTVSIDAGSTLVTYTINNTGTGTMAVGAITFSGVNASDFTVTTSPSSTIAGGGTTSFVVSFHPSTTGTKTATMSIVNDDANENPYNFDITGLGVRTYADTDGDTVSDNLDSDDDNDGILDVTEQTECVTSPFASSVTYTFLNETFGTGTTRGLININIPGATCTYCFEDGIVGPDTAACPSQSSKIIDDGEYTVVYKIAGTLASDPENVHGDLLWNGLEDHTVGDTNGRMAVFNASYTPGIFYETTITGIIPNVPITYSFWALNIVSKSIYTGTILPNITVEFLDTSGTIISTFNTGDIGRCTGSNTLNTCTYSEWRQYSTSVNLGNITAFTIRFKNNAPGGGGNDLAIDDITLKQQYCDRDGDGIANLFDLDSDNDGIPDIEEAGYKNMSAGKATMDLTAATWADADHNGLTDSIDTAIAGGTYAIPDTDLDGTKDFQDLDCDNDSIFDVDESGTINGDGDINGDGFGDGIDTDKDGILDLFDTSASFGTTVRSFAADTDGNGTADYRQLDSNSDGVKDIIGTLYTSFDANSDGKIDGATDVDQDGILDSFDTKTTALGSPRDLNKKLFLDFDGRNDYGEGTQLLSGLSKATIMGWIKLNGLYTANGFVIGQDNFNLKVNVSSGNYLSATANGITVTYATPMSVDRWYHITAVYDGSNATEKLKLYVNGNQEIISNNGALAGTLAASTAKFTLGKNATASTEYFKGSIDEVRIFNNALTTDQIQKMVYQEIKQNGTAIRGEVVPKDIESSTWANLLAYYRMDAYKDDVIDNYTTASIDAGSSSSFARIYNVKNIKYQLAPMPFITTQSSSLDLAVSQNNYVNGMDIFNYDWSIVKIKHNINLGFNMTNLGLFIDPSVNVVLNNDNALKNTWYFLLNGKVDLQGKSQLVQTAASDLDPASSGYIERDQQGTANKFNYNYWSSPVGAINSTTNNNNYTVAGVFKDGTNAANPQDISWTSGLNSSPTSPITLSSYWIFKFQNVNNSYANWASVGPNGSLVPGQGYTLKGSNAATATQNYVFVGKPNNGVISSPIAANNLNLCGNPYASALDADAFITDNLGSLTGTLYFWEHFTTNNTHNLADYQGGYATRTLVGGTPPVSPSGVSNLGSSTRKPGRFIPVGQGFFVTANTTGGTVKFNNTQRAFIREDNATSNIMFRHDAPVVNETDSYNGMNNNEDVFAPDTYGKIRLGFNSTNSYHRQILIGFMDDKATAGYDAGYDAIHIDNQPNDMYFMNGTNRLNIQGDGYFNTASIYPLGIKVGTEGTINFILDGIENFNENQEIYIYDNVTNLYHDIKDSMFEISLPSGTIEDRFSLRFTAGTLGVGEVTLENGIFVAYANASSILNIKNNVADTDVEAVSLYNMLGQSIASWKVDNQDQHNIQIPVKHLSAGTYIVKMQTTKGDFSKKIIVK